MSRAELWLRVAATFTLMTIGAFVMLIVAIPTAFLARRFYAEAMAPALGAMVLRLWGVRVRVHGTVTLIKAPTVHWADTSMFSLLGSYGPGGAGSSQLLVQVSAYWGSNRYDLSFPTSQQSGDTAISQIYYYDHAVPSTQEEPGFGEGEQA